MSTIKSERGERADRQAAGKRHRSLQPEASRGAANFTLSLIICLATLSAALICSHEAAAFELGPAGDVDDHAHLLSARSELVSNNIGRDGEGDLRSLSAASDDDDNDNGNQDEARAYYGPVALGARSGDMGAVARNEIYLLEDKDYPRSLFEDYPRRVGQVSGITTLPSNDLAIFHRSGRQWTAETFNLTSMQVDAGKQNDLISNDTIMIIDRENGGSVTSFGSHLFYMPHSIASDQAGNLWVSDVARHQVMRLPVATSLLQQTESLAADSSGSGDSDNADKMAAGASRPAIKRQVWPDIILGEAFVPGDDQAHFCQPSEIAVSSDGRLVFVADGYCNRRVMVFSGAGQYLTSFGQQHNLTVVHSLALIEERNLLCVADRENGRILCYHAGLDGDYARLGELIRYVDYPLGRVFALTSLSADHLLVSSNQKGTNRYDLAILNPFTNELKLVWISTDLLEPHSLASTRDRQTAYAADISKDSYKKVFKFNIIKRRG